MAGRRPAVDVTRAALIIPSGLVVQMFIMGRKMTLGQIRHGVDVDGGVGLVAVAVAVVDREIRGWGRLRQKLRDVSLSLGSILMPHRRQITAFDLVEGAIFRFG